MTLSNPKKYYSRFLKGHEGKLHFAAHSHHFWPDVSRDAQMSYWDECSTASDEKWNKIFSDIIPGTQRHIARMLNLKDSGQITFAPNTHELTTRLLSHFLGRTELSILTTTSEFHSWKRQITRLKELSQVKVREVSSENFLKNKDAFMKELKAELQKGFDLFFISQVFFDSGLALTDDDLLELAEAKAKTTIMVVDGYHGFAAIPSDLSKLEGKIFYLGGGYKYAQAGEGVGFMVIPKGEWRPAYTGWFAEYAELKSPPGSLVGYSQDWLAFMGATQDASGFYRFKAVWDQFLRDGVTISAIHTYVKGLQKAFIKGLPKAFLQEWKLTPLFDPDLHWHGHFLTFHASDIESAEACQLALKNANILIDRRGQRLRFGFGTYQDQEDIEKLLNCLNKMAKNSHPQ